MRQHVIYFGSIGGILDHCFDESYLRSLVAENPLKELDAKRPVRLAVVIQLGTYDGTLIYNARQVVDIDGPSLRLYFL